MAHDLVKQQLRDARSKFAAMAVTYGLGVFNDSFFRQAAMLLAVAGGAKHMQGWIMAIFTLPYILLASPAGWMADRFSKRRVVVTAKLIELLAMLCGAVGMCTGQWWLILAMVFTMGLQSCLFSPALNGSIPELYPPTHVIQANAVLKVVVTGMILAGISVSGLALSTGGTGWGGVPMGRLVVALTAVAIAAAGVLGSLGVPARPAAAPGAKFPWTGPLDTVRQLGEVRRDRLLLTVVVANVFAWFGGSALIPLINVLAVEQLGRSEAAAGYMVAVQVLGVATGGLIGGRLAPHRPWHRLLPAAVAALAVPLLLMAAVPLLPGPWRLAGAVALLSTIGLMGGLFLIPCEGFVQVRPASHRRGIVIASVNFAVFSGILISGPVANLLNALMRPTTGIAVVGCVYLPVALWLWRTLSKGVRE